MTLSKECPKCKANSNGLRMIIAVAVLSLSALAFVAAGINDDIQRLDERFLRLDVTLQREIDLADNALKGEIVSLQKQIDTGFQTQVNDVNLLDKRINLNDGWIRNHIEAHP